MENNLQYNTNSQNWEIIKNLYKTFGNNPRNAETMNALKGYVGAFPVIGAPVAASEIYSGIKEGNPLQAGLGALGFAGGVAPAAKYLSPVIAKATMPLRNAQINIEATSPAILQGANASRQGQFLSDLRYDTARKAASDAGMKMANAPVTKTQGIWVDPETLAEEFNRVYSQNIGRLPKTPIEFNPQVKAYAESMGGDLGQWGVGASRFSPLPFNINKQAANSILYPKATAKDIIEAGKKLNPKGGVVSATPQGGMIVFNPEVTMTTQEMASQLKNVSSKPRYGLLDSNLFMTNEVPQGNYMSNVDDLIRGLGY
jgi:hypothetical protein